MQDTIIPQLEHQFPTHDDEPEDQEWLSVSDIYKEWGIAGSSISGWKKQGTITEWKKIGSKFLYRRADISRIYWQSQASCPNTDTIIEEAEFKRSFGMRWHIIIETLAAVYGLTEAVVQSKIAEKYPEVNRPAGPTQEWWRSSAA